MDKAGLSRVGGFHKTGPDAGRVSSTSSMLAFHLGLDSGGPDNAEFSLQEKWERGLDNRKEPAVVRNSITWGLLSSGNVHKLEEDKERGRMKWEMLQER